MINTTGQQFNNWTVLEDNGETKILCQCKCGTVKWVNKYTVTHGKSISCGCLNTYKRLEGQKFGYWEVIKDIDKEYALCKCICGREKEVQKAHLKNGTSKSCGCKKREDKLNYDLVGKRFNYLTVIEPLGKGKILCKCDCGQMKEMYIYRVLDGTTKSCGCKSSQLKAESNFVDYTGKTVNEWTILEELGDNKVKCRCSCGNIRILKKATILNGTSKSCGHNTNAFKNTEGQKFGSWEIIKELGNGYVHCKCECGTDKIMQKALITAGLTKSCGCNKYNNFKNTFLARYNETVPNKLVNPRTQWQIDAVSSKDSLEAFMKNNFKTKPTIIELTKALGINESSIGRLLKKYELESFVDLYPKHSQYEKELMNFITSIYSGEVKQSDRTIIHPMELDIYIPDKKLAIEFNGNYWHSTIYKDEKYHQEKTIECKKKGIRLIHIFEYEWKNADRQNKIKNIIKTALNGSSNVIYARDTKVTEIETAIAKAFEDKYHLQGGTNSSINIALTYNDEIVALLAMGAPRFNSNFEYEIIRMCYKQDCIVVGGLEKLFSHFIKNYNPSSIITYCDLSKFIGDSYIRLGFKPFDGVVTKPNYVWYDYDAESILSRYQTQKSKLVELGLGTEQQTENEIMESLNYIKIYDSGNLKLHWTK